MRKFGRLVFFLYFCKQNIEYMRILLTFLAFVLSFNVVFADDGAITWTEIEVDTPGSLPFLIGEERKNEITSLKVTGSLNGTDILFLREMAGVNYNNYPNDLGKLSDLDLSGASIVSGGDAYINYSYQNYNTEDNVIGPYMFYNSNLTMLILPNSITEIKERAISELDNLTNLELGSGVKVLGEYSISSNDKLGQLTIPDNVTDLGDYVFYDNRKLKNITLSTNIEAIPDYAFSHCFILENFTLPSQVKSIGSYAFRYCHKLTTMSLPQSITTLSPYTFAQCDLLESVTLPDALESIGEYAFSDCGKLQSIELPASLTSIGQYAFNGCAVLANVQIPNAVTSIGQYAFSGCDAFTEITIPSGITVISDYTFSGCNNLGRVVLPSSVTQINRFAFNYCTNLTDINITDAITTFGVGAFSRCESLTQFSIPRNVTILPERFFEYSGLTSITIPSTVETIKSNSFYSCQSLEDITIQEGVKKIEDEAFAYCNKLGSITIPQTVTNLETYIFQECKNLESVVINCPTTSIPGSMFSGCSKLTSLTLPDGLTSIGSSAFEGCSALQDFQIPSTVSTIGSHAFQGCTSLLTITIPESVTTINSYAFYGCVQLASVSLPTTLTQIYSYAFGNCQSLETISVPSKVKTIGEHVFSGCSALTSFVWPEAAAKVSEHVFDDCTSLASISLPSGITTIGNYAFGDCSSLTSIDLPESVKTIGYDAFKGAGVRSIIIPSQVKTIEEYTFSDCSDLNSVTIPDGLTTIQNNAFQGCTSLTSISIPASLTSIQSYAFNGCSSLVEVHVHIMSPLSISSSTFGGNDSGCTLYVPDGCLTAYQNANYWKDFPNIVEEAEGGDGVALAETDWALLKHFYESMTTTNWTNKWVFAETAAATGPLKGVVLHQGHVIRISLPQNNMVGTLSSVIFMLPELQELDLSGNALEGDITELEELVADNPAFTSKLTYLDISNNLFTGNIGVVGEVFGSLATLKASNCHISDVNPVLPETITTVELENQTIDQEISFNDIIAKKALSEKIPTIWLYDPDYRSYSSGTYLYMCDDWENQYTSLQLLLYLYDNNDPSVDNWHWGSYSDDYRGDNNAMIEARTYPSTNYHAMKIRFAFNDGDTNMNGAVDVLDLQHMINRIFGQNGSVFNFTAGNLIKDEVINVQDVIAMVNLMMDNDISTTSSTRMLTRAVDDHAEVNVSIDNGQLIFDAIVPVSSFDLTIESDGTEDLDLTPLTELGLQYRLQRKGNLTRIIAYSLTGSSVHAGRTVIATGKMSQVVIAKGADAKARPVRMSGTYATTGILSLTEGIRIHIKNGQIVLESQGNRNHIEWQLYSLSGQLIDSGVIEHLNVGSTVLGNSLPHQAILRVKADGETIVKKMSNK